MSVAILMAWFNSTDEGGCSVGFCHDTHLCNGIATTAIDTIAPKGLTVFEIIVIPLF